MLLLNDFCHFERLAITSAFSDFLVNAFQARVLKCAARKLVETKEAQEEARSCLDDVK
jgi:hypothetical protein